MGKPVGSPGYKAITSATNYLFRQIDKKRANSFTEQLVTGLNLQEQTDAVAVLRGQLISFASVQQRIKPNSTQIFRLFCLAWNARMQNRAVKMSYKVLPAGRRRTPLDGFPKGLFLKTYDEILTTIPGEEEPEENS
ncbi:unnamed protein product [marine sediment metagenome]|uniref:Uncharacterized protein n=1 Tax=marine sediment metagenome TaxID=412755 RepID=X1KZ16_9ZZZZ